MAGKSLIRFYKKKVENPLFLGKTRRVWKSLVLVLLFSAWFFPRVNAPFAFSISVSPDNAQVPQGWSTKANVSVALVDTPTREVTLSATKTPNEASITVAFNPPGPLNAPFASRIDLSTTTSTPEGSYLITITGTPSSGTPLSTAFTLVVTPLYTVSLSPATDSVLPGNSLTTSVSVGGVKEAVVYSYQIKYVDTNDNNSWDTGEAVVLDGNDNGFYDSGETLIAGTPTVGKPLKFDLRLGFIDANNDNSRNSAETVVCDCNGNGVYDTNEFVIFGTAPPDQTPVTRSQLLAGTTPTWGTLLKDDAKVKYYDANNSLFREGTECTFYDNDNGNDLDAGEPVIAGTCPGSGTVTDDARIKYEDSNNNSIWVTEAVSLSCPSPPAGVSCSFNPTNGTPSFGSGLSISAASNLAPGIYGITVRGTSGGTGVVKQTTFTLLVPAVIIIPAVYHGTVLTQFLFNVTVVGFPSFNTFDIIVGYSHTSGGGPLDALQIIVPSADADVWPANALVAPAGESVDSEIRFVDSNGSNNWNLGETVVRDSNGNGLYNTGELVITGSQPPSLTPLKDDPHIKYVDANGNFVWDNVPTIENMVYDSDSDGAYDAAEPVIVGSAPVVGTTVRNEFGEVRFGQASSLHAPSGTSGLLFSVKFNITQPGSTSIIFVRHIVGSGSVPLSHVIVQGSFCKILADIDNNGVVNVVDLARVGAAFGKSQGEPGFDAAADVNRDGVINVADLATVGSAFGRTC